MKFGRDFTLALVSLAIILATVASFFFGYASLFRRILGI
jgi:hypothetical protein